MSYLTTIPTTLVTFLLDKSGSMLIVKETTIEAFNGYVGGLQQAAGAQILFSFLQFDTESVDKVCIAVPVSDVRPLTDATYLPHGGTPLIDAAVKTIVAVEAQVALRTDNPKVVICFQTDGHENASTEHTWQDLHALIEEKTALGWQFNFMGAGIDAYEQGAKMGVSAANTMSYDRNDRGATNHAFAASASNTANFAMGRSQNTNYSPDQRAASGDRFRGKPDPGTITGIAIGPTVRPPRPKLDVDLTK